jgi:uroporphyrin-III C-methyltransferase/precorrin-2 dehydrogenase/sirohydrochlorin ferrochelatase
MNLLPLHINLKNKTCLVVGGGEVAARKIDLLLRVKAKVVVVAPEVCEAVASLVKEQKITWQERTFVESDIGDQTLIIAATNNKSVNEKVSELAHQKNIPVNVVDAPDLCSVIFPAIVDRDPLIIAISSGGTSPVLARFVRGKIESVISEQFGELAKMLEAHRDEIRKQFPQLNERRAFVEGLLNGSVAEHVLSGDVKTAEALLKEALTHKTTDNPTSGVYIVYCPNEVDLLSFRALRFMQQADVVFHSESVNPLIVDLTRRDAHRILIPEVEPLATLTKHAHNKRIVWLKTKPLDAHANEESSIAIETTGLATLLIENRDQTPTQGEVYLVGGGPGDADLLTFKALRLMQQADVVLYDRLVSEQILALTNPSAEKIFVGKERTNHPVPQEQINELLIRFAKQGKRVLRLKGGDPFIFGRGGEEISELCAHKIPFQVVPGITAATACSTYAGIPLTHRDYAHSVRFVAGHVRKDGQSDINWQNLCVDNETLVFYMGLHQLPVICENLMANGMNSDMPVALVQAGSLPEQQVITGTLSNIQTKLAEHPLQPPTLIIVGRVVTLRDQLAWFKQSVSE